MSIFPVRRYKYWALSKVSVLSVLVDCITTSGSLIFLRNLGVFTTDKGKKGTEESCQIFKYC